MKKQNFLAAGAGSELLFRKCCNIIEKHYNSKTYTLENLINRTIEDNEFKDLRTKDGKFKIILTDGQLVYEMDKKGFRDISKLAFYPFKRNSRSIYEEIRGKSTPSFYRFECLAKQFRQCNRQYIQSV